MAKSKESRPAGGPSQEAIAKRAYELSLQRGSLPGHEVDDWLQAEAELTAAAAIADSRESKKQNEPSAEGGPAKLASVTRLPGRRSATSPASPRRTLRQ
jgi:hypothetical protein